MEKQKEEKYAFQLTKCNLIFFPLLFVPLLLSKLLTFSFLVILSNLKCYRSATFSSTNRLGTVIAIEQHTQNFWGVRESALQHSVVYFFQFLTPSILGGAEGSNFLISNPSVKKFSASDMPRGGVQVLFGHHKQPSPTLGSGLRQRLPTVLPYIMLTFDLSYQIGKACTTQFTKSTRLLNG